MKKAALFLLIAAVFIGLIYSATFSVREFESAVVTRFGRPVQIADGAGLHFKIPFIDNVAKFEKRTSSFETKPIQLLLGDKSPIILNCYIAWKIDDAKLFFEVVGYSSEAKQKLNGMVTSELGIVLGDYSMKNIISTVPGDVKLVEIEQKIKSFANKNAEEKYGIKIVQVGIERIAYPNVVVETVYDRMKSERKKEAAKLRAEGREEAMKIKVEADKTAKEIEAKAYKMAEIEKGEGDRAAMKIYSEAYQKDPEFFDFLKSLETYKKILNSETTLILSTESELFKYLDLNTKHKRKK